MATGIRCPRCEVLNRDDVRACRACGAPLPQLPSSTSSPSAPAPPPATPPRILRPSQPTPLRPPSLEKLPPARTSAAAPAAPPAAPVGVTASSPLEASAGVATVAAPAARRTPTARAPTPPPPRPGSSARPEPVSVRPIPAGKASGERAAGAPRVTVAPFFRALLATLIDGLVVGGLALALTVVFAGALTEDAATTTRGLFGALELVNENPAILGLFAGLALALSAGLSAALLPWKGATLGGLVAGVEVIVGSTGARPGFPGAALRGLLSALGGLLLLVGPLWALWLDPLRRGLGDVATGTLPVKRQRPT